MKSKALSEQEQTKIAIGMLQVLDQEGLAYDSKLEIIGTVLFKVDQALSGKNGVGIREQVYLNVARALGSPD